MGSREAGAARSFAVVVSWGNLGGGGGGGDASAASGRAVAEMVRVLSWDVALECNARRAGVSLSLVSSLLQGEMWGGGGRGAIRFRLFWWGRGFDLFF